VTVVRPSLVDPRGQRFAAAITSVVLAATLVTGSAWLLALQGVVFAVSVFRGVHASPYAWVFRRFVRPRLAPAAEFEDARPPRFAQGVGLGFAVVGVVAAALGATPVFLVATGLALAAAFLNAAFGFCLGCEVYLLIRRYHPSHDIPTREEISA
jgi:hypothetical protein